MAGAGRCIAALALTILPRPINTELDAVSLSISGIRTNLAKIQRDDGGLRNGIVTKDSLAPSLKDELYAEFSGNINDSVLEAQQAAVEATNAAAAANADAATAVAARDDAQAAATSAQASAAASSASQAAAAGSATSAANSATSATGSASAASGSASAAATSATTATNAASAASGSAATASGAESTATTAKNDAQAAAASASGSASVATGSAALAKDWANKTSGPVDGSEYSAKFYAEMAMTGAGLPRYLPTNKPTSDVGDIYVEGDGIYHWNGTAYARTDISLTAIAAIRAAVFGVGQSWQNLTSSRLTNGTTYVNSTTKPIMVSVQGVGSGSTINMTMVVAGAVVARPAWPGTHSGATVANSFIVPPGSSYSVLTDGVISITWMEYR